VVKALYTSTFGCSAEEKLMYYNAVVFTCFSFLWLYCLQADMLTVAQHVLSGGKTSYHPLLGAMFITVVLLLLQQVVSRILRLRVARALTYFPSLLLLAMLTSVGQNIDHRFTFGAWYWVAPLLLLVWAAAVWVARQLEPPRRRKVSQSLFAPHVWKNLLLMSLMMMGVAAASNTNAVFHYRVHAEKALTEGDFDEALRTGSRSLETDSSLTMVRMYALSRKGLLGERLFSYPVVSSSDVMLPTSGSMRLLLYPTDSLYRYLGAVPRRPMQPMEYLNTILRSGQAKPAVADYLLCGYLIDKDIDSFAREISRFYKVNDSLPRHYREALVLYTHQRCNPVLVYHDTVLDVDFDDMKKLEDTCEEASERKGKILENYADSYWYYYFYVASDGALSDSGR